MQHWGKHSSGTRRWRCQDCGTNAVWKRKDNRHKKRLSLFVRWLTGKTTLSQTASSAGVSVQAISKWFRPFWQNPPKPEAVPNPRVLVLDATSIVPRSLMLLIAGDGKRHRPVSWTPSFRECHASWLDFLRDLMWDDVEPEVVVCDGQRGLLKAIHDVWPKAMVQRCLVHVVRQASMWLTQNPKTRTGLQLLELVRRLTAIRTRRQKRRWVRAFHSWERRHERFLKDRTYGPSGRWWYTHRKLRGVRSLLRNAIPDLFRFITDPTIPRTSNHVEGGLNARLKELMRCHRGISATKKLALASWYLALRQDQEPTR